MKKSIVQIIIRYCVYPKNTLDCFVATLLAMTSLRAKRSNPCNVIFAVAVVALAVIGCGDDGIGTQTDERVGRFLNRFIENHPLILGPGQAWVELDNADYGFIFYENGYFDFIEKKADGQWNVNRAAGTWTVGGEINYVFNYRYRFVGEVLLLEKSSNSGSIETIRFTKQNGVNVM